MARINAYSGVPQKYAPYAGCVAPRQAKPQPKRQANELAEVSTPTLPPNSTRAEKGCSLPPPAPRATRVSGGHGWPQGKPPQVAPAIVGGVAIGTAGGVGVAVLLAQIGASIAGCIALGAFVGLLLASLAMLFIIEGMKGGR